VVRVEAAAPVVEAAAPVVEAVAPVVEAAAPDAVSAASAHVAAKATGTRMAREVRPRRSTRAVGGERFTPTTIPGEAKPRV